MGEHGKCVGQVGNAHLGVRDSILHLGGLLSQQDDVSASGLHLPHVGDGLCKNMLLGGDGDDRHPVRYESNGAVL